MIVVIQCAAGKQDNAGCLRTPDDRKFMFVANSDYAPSCGSQIYAHPDDNSDRGKSWRTVLREYNCAPEDNPFGLLQAWRLYKDRTYGVLKEHCGLERLYVLSAGRGLIHSDFLTPDYDITFSKHKNVESFKRRRDHDEFHDFNMLPPDREVVVVVTAVMAGLRGSQEIHFKRCQVCSTYIQAGGIGCCL